MIFILKHIHYFQDYFCKFQIVSWFYYWRAAWNVVERKLAFPEQPLPDPKMLRMDFDTCVRAGNLTHFCVNKLIKWDALKCIFLSKRLSETNA